MQWKHLLTLANKKFKTQASAGKVVLTIFWDDTKNFYKYSCKKVIIKFLLFNDLPLYNTVELFLKQVMHDLSLFNLHDIKF